MVWAAVVCTAWAQDEEPADTGSPPPETAAGEEPPEAEPEEEPRTVNLIIQGEEPDRWNLDVGGGWNEDDGLYGRLALATTNFLGRGEILGVKLELGDKHELYELEYRKPFLFGRRQFLGVRLFEDATDRTVADTDFGRRRSGVTLGWGRRFGAHHSVELEYRFADVDETEAIVLDESTILRQASYASSSIRPRWVFSTLDSRFEPFEGLRLAGSLELAGGVLGGDSELVEPVFGLTWFQPLTSRPLRSTLSVRTRLGWLEGDEGEVFSQQRFFLGGEASVRGFRRRSLAVLASDGTLARDDQGFPLGGERMAQLNLEYHLLFGKRFRLVLFADAGGVFSEGQGFDADLARTSAGTELRFSLPRLRVPLRLIYAHNLDPLPEDRFEDLSFSFGLSF